MIQTIKDYLPLIIFGLIAFGSGYVMYKSRKDDEGKWEQEDEDNSVIEMDIDWDIGEEEIKKRLN